MELGASVWAEVMTVGVAWLTVVCLLLARVPKPPSLLDSSLDGSPLEGSPLDVDQPEDSEPR